MLWLQYTQQFFPILRVSHRFLCRSHRYTLSFEPILFLSYVSHCLNLYCFLIMYPIVWTYIVSLSCIRLFEPIFFLNYVSDYDFLYTSHHKTLKVLFLYFFLFYLVSHWKNTELEQSSVSLESEQIFKFFLTSYI